MPIYPDPTPASVKSLMDPSVLDSPIRKGLRAVGGLIGVNDPSAQVMGMAGGPTEVPAAIEKAPSHAAQALIDLLDSYSHTTHPIDAAKAFLGERLHSLIPSPPAFRQPAEASIPVRALKAHSFPSNAHDAFLIQDGFTGGFGQSPEMDYVRSGQQDYFDKVGLSEGGKRGLNTVNLPRFKAQGDNITMIQAAPAVRSLEDFQAGGNSGVPQTNAPYKPLLGKMNNGVAKAIARSKVSGVLNEDMVREIRNAGAAGRLLPDIAAQYPSVNKETIRGVLNGGSWGWVK